jgi:hypothetical protein
VVRRAFIAFSLICFTATPVWCQTSSTIALTNRIVDTINVKYGSGVLLKSIDSLFHKQNGIFTEYYVDSADRLKLIIQLIKYADSEFISESYYYRDERPIYATRLTTDSRASRPECRFYFIGRELYELGNEVLFKSDDSIFMKASNFAGKTGAISR